MSSVAIIPARAGSKRIPGKNIQDFMGKPIIAYSIEMAFDSGLFDRVIVSTDSKKIKEIAEDYGAEVPSLRPAHLANDITGVLDVIRYEAGWFPASVDYCCLIYATAPLLLPVYLREGYLKMKKSGAPYVISVDRFGNDAGQFCWCRVDALLQEISLYSLGIGKVVIPCNRIRDINTHEDWHRALAMYQELNGGSDVKI